jgi:N-acylneuraminate cytidylyltransferase
LNALGVIPARGGSKGVPRKNLREIGGETLVARAVRCALAARTLDLVVVSTDDDEIAAAAEAAGARVVRRPADLAGDESPTVDALLHAVETLGARPRWVVTLEPTAPFRRPGTIDRCVELAEAREAGAVVTVRADRSSFGRVAADGRFEPLDASAPRRRQDREPLHAEAGVVWVTRTASLVAARSVLAEPVYAVVVDEEEALDVNSELDFRIAQAVAHG